MAKDLRTQNIILKDLSESETVSDIFLSHYTSAIFCESYALYTVIKAFSDLEIVLVIASKSSRYS